MAGHVWTSRGQMSTFNNSSKTYCKVRNLDEIILIINRKNDLGFDEDLPGFHLYGTDICLESEKRKMKCYAIDNWCFHNETGYNIVPKDYFKSVSYIRNKWKQLLPIRTPCFHIKKLNLKEFISWHKKNLLRKVFKKKTINNRIKELDIDNLKTQTSITGIKKL